MGKRRSRWDYKHYLQGLRDGCGQGTGADYKPQITIHDLPSQGVSARVFGHTTGRIHHLLSRLEEYYFYLMDFDPDVLDIREQFPLRLTETLEIASCLNIRHPQMGSFPYPITTDFLITREDGLHARTVKPSAELEKRRVLEKFSIECQYWKEKCIDWKIVTEKDINWNRARNLQWLNTGIPAKEAVPDTALREEACACMLELLSEKQLSFPLILETVGEALSLAQENVIPLFKDLILSRQIALNLDLPINFMNPLS